MENNPIFYCIYQISNMVNNKIYVGAHATKNLNDNYMGSGSILKKAFKKHGIENFVREILFIYDNKKEMYVKEVEIVNEEFIARIDTYNIKVGGCGGGIRGRIMSKEQKEKLAASKRGKSRSPECIAKISVALKGKKISPEALQKRYGTKNSVGHVCSEAQKQRLREVHNGRVPSLETREKISIANTGKKRSVGTKQNLSNARARLLASGWAYSEETRQQMSVVHKGKKLSEEHCKNIGIALSRRVCKDSTRKKISIIHKGMITSEETKLKQSIAKKGRALSETHKYNVGLANNIKYAQIRAERVILNYFT